MIEVFIAHTTLLTIPFPPHIYEGVRLRLKPKYLQRIGVEAKNNVVHCQAAIFDCC